MNEISHVDRKVLLNAALEAKNNSYSPYSSLSIGAALLAVSGKIYTGSYIEEASYCLSLCPERIAWANAMSCGERNFKAIGLVSKEGFFPCGACRQVLLELGDIWVLIWNDKKELLKEILMSKLLPLNFSSDYHS